MPENERLMSKALPKSIDETQALLAQGEYVADRSLATSLFLSLAMKRPLFLEGEAGVGKTEIGKVVAQALGRELIRLQCYEGLDIAQAAYEWNYPRQMIEIRMAEAEGVKSREGLEQDIFSERFLIRRPLLRALQPLNEPPVLLIDELDRTDEPFEAYLLEVLSDWQITIPEVGTVKAAEPPVVIITSNRTREIHDAVKRRCFYHWVDYPDAKRELAILRRKAPKAAEGLSREVVAFVQQLRKVDLFKLPGVAETIDWANCLAALDRVVLDPETVNNTLGVLLKYRDDLERIAGDEAGRLVGEAKAAAARVSASASCGARGRRRRRTGAAPVALCDALLAVSGEYASMRSRARRSRPTRRSTSAAAASSSTCWRAITRRRPRPSRSSAIAYQADPSPQNLARLQEAVEPLRRELFRRLNMAPGGTAALVEMRKELLKGLRANPQWRVIDSDLLHLLREWFNRGFLRLERIDWRTPAIVLEKLIEYEAVHAMQGWRDLRRRLEADRRCFALLPSAAARRADHLHRGGAHAQHERAHPAAARRRRAGRRRRTATARCSIRSPTARKGCAASRSATC